MPPTALQKGHTYVRITTAKPDELRLPEGFQYVGPVGELDDEHVFEVTIDGQPVDPAGSFWTAQGALVMQGLKGSGVKAEQLAFRAPPTKRDEF